MGSRWLLNQSTSPANHQKLNIIQKQAFNFFFTGGVWWMGFESIDPPGRSSEVKCNPKMSILFFWLERGGRWGSSPSTSPANHQKLNIIQNKHLIFLAREGWLTGLESIDQPNRSSEVEHNRKTSILFFGCRGVADGFESIDQPSWPPEVECNPKTSILFFWLERGGRWGSSPLNSLANIKSWT